MLYQTFKGSTVLYVKVHNVKKGTQIPCVCLNSLIVYFYFCMSHLGPILLNSEYCRYSNTVILTNLWFQNLLWLTTALSMLYNLL